MLGRLLLLLFLAMTTASRSRGFHCDCAALLLLQLCVRSLQSRSLESLTIEKEKKERGDDRNSCEQLSLYALRRLVEADVDWQITLTITRVLRARSQMRVRSLSCLLAHTPRTRTVGVTRDSARHTQIVVVGRRFLLAAPSSFFFGGFFGFFSAL